MHKFNNFDLHIPLKILIIDNYDSFTYNLAHYIEGIINDSVDVVRNDRLRIEELTKYDKIVISPGPGLPQDAGVLMQAINNIPISTPVLGVCLGMQALAQFDGIKLFNLNDIRHGVSVKCTVENSNVLFNGLPDSIEVGLYHSWAVKKELNKDWNVTATSGEGILMAMSHKIKPIHCVQFHPESVLTPAGRKIIKNFILNA